MAAKCLHPSSKRNLTHSISTEKGYYYLRKKQKLSDTPLKNAMAMFSEGQVRTVQFPCGEFFESFLLEIWTRNFVIFVFFFFKMKDLSE